MKREVGFYVIIPGLSIYCTLILVLYFYPVMAAYHGTLTTDDTIMYTFMTVFFYPISLALVALGNQGTRIMNWRWAIPISLSPIAIAAAWIIWFT